MRSLFFFLAHLTCLQLFACSNKTHEVIGSSNVLNTDSMKLKITIGTDTFRAALYNNTTTDAFKEMLPLSINMKELNGNEKYFDLPDKLPSSPSNPGKIQAGDLKLYGSNTLVLFYKTFSTSYNYTSIGRIDDPSGLAAALGAGSSAVTFEFP